MQVTYARALKKGVLFTLPWLKILILGGSLFYVVQRIVAVYPSFAAFPDLQYAWTLGLLVLLLAPMNWLFEAYKWRALVRPVQPITLSQSYQSVLSGISLSIATPRALGDYAGRVLSLKGKQRLQALPLVGVARITQMVPTAAMGLFGIGYMWKYLPLRQPSVWMIVGGGLILSCMVILIPRIRKKWRQLPSFSTLLCVTALSFGRYFIFTTQFLLLLYICNVEATIDVLFAGVTWIFLVKSILPSLSTFADLGVRELSAVLFFEAAGVPIIPVVSASLLLWIVNLLLPSLLGLFAIFKTRV